MHIEFADDELPHGVQWYERVWQWRQCVRDQAETMPA
jgi:hypothetical protein